jgi:hypothetical protein
MLFKNSLLFQQLQAEQQCNSASRIHVQCIVHPCAHSRYLLLTAYLLQDWDSAFGLGSALMRDAEALQLPLPSAGATPSAAAQALRTQAARLRELEEQAAELRHSRDSAAAGARAALVSAVSLMTHYSYFMCTHLLKAISAVGDSPLCVSHV